MRFLHLSTGDGPGGAYTGAYRLHESLRAEGHESHMFVLRKASQDPDVLAPSRVTVFCARVVNRLRTELMNRFILKPSEYSRHFFSYRYVAGMGRLLGEGLRKPDRQVAEENPAPFQRTHGVLPHGRGDADGRMPLPMGLHGIPANMRRLSRAAPARAKGFVCPGLEGETPSLFCN